ncbi:hypothetical protein [Nocardioides sp. CFH 31398]|uniref:hypothetical protein n=1 Tax=Nocardioides sp. CFH 31398 TaxID=2919579 RepID=UPI001F05F886|nr:hypothetical protein [Nocardioides sp. CFH 31398]MCH1868339.1 hypothetical protein [Nocardioides sp. CFH 31398]
MTVRPPPVPEPRRARAAAWREAVLDLRYGERRRVFPTVVHVGRPGGACAGTTVPLHPGVGGPPWDHALRADLVGALLDRHRAAAEPWCWLTRTGGVEPHDDDLAWLAAARTAYGEAGVDLVLAVVTRAGWYEPTTGDGRAWKRLRRAPTGPAGVGAGP